MSDGSIIATIIATHMARKDTAAPGHDWPGIRIHTECIDIASIPDAGQTLPYAS